MESNLPVCSEIRLAIIGLGYVGLPLAVEFGKKRSVVGFDINKGRIAELAEGTDSTQEVSPLDLSEARFLRFSSQVEAIRGQVEVHDPWVSEVEALRENGINLTLNPDLGSYNAVILPVAHHEFRNMGAKAVRDLGKPSAVIYDLKYVLSQSESDLRL